MVIATASPLAGEKRKSLPLVALAFPVACAVLLAAGPAAAQAAPDPFGLGWLEQLKTQWAAYAVLVLLFVANLVVLLRMRLDASASSRRELAVAELERLNQKITLFYNPLSAMLAMNEDMQRKFGPESWTTGNGSREEARLLWEDIKNSIVWENNKKILKLLVEYTHFVDDEAEAEVYKKLRAHLLSNFAALERKIDLQRKYDFPSNTNYTVKNARDLMLRKRDRVMGELGRYLRGE